MPANYGVGLAWWTTRSLTLAADVPRIEFSEVQSVGNSPGLLCSGHPFGTLNGGGFGWKDVTVVNVGVRYVLNDGTLQAGYSHARQPIPQDQTIPNILAPGVVPDHLRLGATWRQGKSGELSLADTHGFKKTVNGSGSIPNAYGGGEADIPLAEEILGIAYGSTV